MNRSAERNRKKNNNKTPHVRQLDVKFISFTCGLLNNYP